MKYGEYRFSHRLDRNSFFSWNRRTHAHTNTYASDSKGLAGEGSRTPVKWRNFDASSRTTGNVLRTAM